MWYVKNMEASRLAMAEKIALVLHEAYYNLQEYHLLSLIKNVIIFSRAHESWGLLEAPDYVAFAKKLQAAGYFHRPELRPKEV